MSHYNPEKRTWHGKSYKNGKLTSELKEELNSDAIDERDVKFPIGMRVHVIDTFSMHVGKPMIVVEKSKRFEDASVAVKLEKIKSQAVFYYMPSALAEWK